MKKKTFKNQADLFSFVLDEFVEDEETCIGEFCIKNKAQAYENLKAKRNNLAEEWNRLTEERELQIKAEVIDDFQEWLKIQIVGIDNQSKEILVVDGEKWELAIDKYKEHLKDRK